MALDSTITGVGEQAFVPAASVCTHVVSSAPRECGAVQTSRCKVHATAANAARLPTVHIDGGALAQPPRGVA